MSPSMPSRGMLAQNAMKSVNRNLMRLVKCFALARVGDSPRMQCQKLDANLTYAMVLGAMLICVFAMFVQFFLQQFDERLSWKFRAW